MKEKFESAAIDFMVFSSRILPESQGILLTGNVVDITLHWVSTAYFDDFYCIKYPRMNVRWNSAYRAMY